MNQAGTQAAEYPFMDYAQAAGESKLRMDEQYRAVVSEHQVDLSSVNTNQHDVDVIYNLSALSPAWQFTWLSPESLKKITKRHLSACLGWHSA